MAKKHSEYFDIFVNMVGYCCRAADCLRDELNDFDPETLIERRLAMHTIEHEADEEKHRMMRKLAKEFVTPIEREDIIQLANEIDEVTDKIEDVLIRIYIYNLQEIRPEALQFAEVISNCTKALQTAMRELPNFHRSATLQDEIINVNTLEEQGDALYIDAMRALFTEQLDPVHVMAWSDLFDRLEECCDACEHVANVMESVVMNNS